MCGIIGFLDKQPGHAGPIGHVLLKMLQALSCRGPDSAGVAIFSPPRGFWVLQVKLPEQADSKDAAQDILSAVEKIAVVIRHQTTGAYLRLEIQEYHDPTVLEKAILARIPEAEVVSLGHQLEIVKQVGSPARLEQ